MGGAGDGKHQKNKLMLVITISVNYNMKNNLIPGFVVPGQN